MSSRNFTNSSSEELLKPPNPTIGYGEINQADIIDKHFKVELCKLRHSQAELLRNSSGQE